MTENFGVELREQLASARRALEQARAEGDEDGVEAYRGRITALLRIAARNGIDLPHTAEEGRED
ncbi:hypothetical protein AB0D08_24395 [Kitasatospora sp. NPDC048540]|uniref:hypothetical protein n=1 Tax=unclassified Kitasatospora TaxID=2633591 RepID=UPI00053B2E5A|nr:hypothetical protein [Kitasatospora sp. MBT63]